MKIYFQNLLLSFLFGILSMPLYAQTILTVNPDAAYQGQQSLQVNISGTNLSFDQASSVMIWLKQGSDSIAGYNSNWTSANTAVSFFDFSLSAATGLYDLYCLNILLSQTTVLQNGFEILPAPPLPDAPVLISPPDNTTLNNSIISFDWADALNAFGYELIVDDNPSFASPIIHEADLQTSNYPDFSFINSTYYWKVRAKNIVELWGNWSSVNSFTVDAIPQLISINPDTGYQGQQSLQVNISGTNLNFSQASDVIIWLKQANDSIVGYNTYPNSTNTAVSTFDFSLSTPIGFYDLYCFNILSLQTTFLQNGFEILPHPGVPDVPVLITPSDNAMLTGSIVSFDWGDALNAYRYEFVVDDNPLFVTPLIHELNLQPSTYINSNLSFENGEYYWKVRAKNSIEEFSNWSAVNSFTINATPQLVAINPDNGYAGQTNLGVNISGVNTHFIQGTSTQNFWLQQQSYIINPSTTQIINNPFDIEGNLNISGDAPTGYYDLLQNSIDGLLTLFNAFYVHESNEFSGTIFIDANNNQIFDTDEIPYPQGIVGVSSSDAYSFSQSNGFFDGYAPTGNFIFTFTNPPSLYYTFTPSQHSASFLSTGDIDADNNFALHPFPGIHDLRIIITNNTPAPRQGREFRLTITTKNIGTSIESANISVTIPPQLSVVSSSNPSYTISGNTISWNSTNMQLLATEQIILDLFVPVSVPIGTALDFTAQVAGTSQDTTPSDNIDIIDQLIVGPYDPNIKEVSPSAGLTPQQVTDGEYLEYTIHFQNTGTADAINIRILDTLNPFLDITTFEVLAASHPWQARLLDNRLAEFRFDNIHLPDSNANELLSHGFIKYRIKSTPDFGIGDQIENTAYIYFDFNEAIVTNTTVTEIITGLEEQATSKFNLLVSPNPFNYQTNISYTTPQSGIVDIKLYNYQGQLIKTIFNEQEHAGNHKLTINMSELSGGVYFISLSSGQVNELGKLVLIK